MCVSEISRETKKGIAGREGETRRRGAARRGGRVRLGTRSRSAFAEEEDDGEAPLLRQMERLYKSRRITAAPVAIHLVAAFHIVEKSVNR